MLFRSIGEDQIALQKQNENLHSRQVSISKPGGFLRSRKGGLTMQKIGIGAVDEISRVILENLKDGTVISISFNEEGGDEDVREEDGKREQRT